MKIPVKLHSSAQFSERQEIIDASSLLRVMINPQDSLSLLQCLRSPYHRVAEKELQTIARNRGGSTLWGAALKMGIDQVITIQKAAKRALEIGIINAWRETLLALKYFEILHGLDPSGQKEANLWKLINLMQTAERRGGFNPLGVLDDFFQGSLERGDGEGDATPVVEPKKVNLMTIHASKGLEFDYLIVPFMGKRLQRQNANLWMSSEEDQIWTLTIPDPQTGKMTSSIVADNIMKLRADREFQEIERLYYVAFTRAKLGLSLILSKQEEGSFAFRLWQSAIIQKPLELEDFSREIDEVQTAGTATCRLRRRKWTGSQSVREPEEISKGIRPQLYTPKLMMKSISVTSLVSPKMQFSKQNGTKPSTQTESSVQRFEISQRGVHAHKVFENLKYLNVQGDLPGVEFLRTWEMGRLMNLIKAGEVEWGFTVKQNSFYLQGQIDLWGVTAEFPDGAVADYKTGNEANLEMAFAQLEVYAWLLRKMGKLPSQGIPELLVVYPFGRSVKNRKALSTTNSMEYVHRLMEPLLST
jgi:ATP-dependent helicase/nuclease subunit A